MPTKEPDDESSRNQRTPTFVIYTVATVGVAFILLGLVHTVAGLPLVLEAVESGGINLPSIEDTGVRFQLLREPVVYEILSLGVDRCVFGVILLLCVLLSPTNLGVIVWGLR